MAERERKKDAKLTAENVRESERLKAIWESTKDKPSQAQFGELFDIGNQGMVWQCLNGKTPISLKAARGFALGLKVEISAFSQRLAQLAATNAQFAPKLPEAELIDLTSLSRSEAQVVMMFRGLSMQHQTELMRFANTLYAQDHPNHTPSLDPAPTSPSTGGGGHSSAAGKMRKAA